MLTFTDVLSTLDDSDELIYRHAQSAVKFIGNPSDGKVGGYLVAWGSPNQKDLTGEYFTPETDLGINWYDQRPVLYHHGLDGTLKTDVIGVITALKADQYGLWAEAQLDMHKRYVQEIMALVNKGALGWSSGSIAHLVERLDDGQIKRWPIVEGSLTPSPAEPFRTTIRAIKSAFDLQSTDSVEPIVPREPPAKEDAQKDSPIVVSDLPARELIQSDNEEKSTMDMQAICAAVLAELQKARPDVQLTPEEASAIASAAAQALQASDSTMSAQPAPTPEQTAQTIVPAVFKAFTDYVSQKQQSAQAMTNAIKAGVLTAITQQPPAGVPAMSGNGGSNQHAQIDVKRANPLIQMRTKYADLNAEDMDYYIQFRNASRKRAGRAPWNPDAPFMRELVDKAGKSYEKGELKLGDEGETAKAIKSFNAIKSDELDYSTLASGGDEWVPDLWASQVWEKARLDNVIAPLFQNVEMPSNPFELPVQSTDPTVYYVAETKNENTLLLSSSSSPIPDSKMVTAKVTLTASKLALRSMFSSELEEDSIIPWTSQLRKQSLRAIEDAIDNVLLNGDTTLTASTNINLIDGTPGGTEKYLAFKGLRYLPIITTTANKVDAGGIAVTLGKIRQARFTLDRAYSANPKNLAIITHSEMYATLLGLSEFITMDKAGSLATAQTGQIGILDGMPVLVSNEFALTDSAGKIPTAGGTLGSLVIAYNPGWYMGYRRKVNATIDFLSYYDAYVQTATVRLAFINRDAEVAAAVYNALV